MRLAREYAHLAHRPVRAWTEQVLADVLEHRNRGDTADVITDVETVSRAAAYTRAVKVGEELCHLDMGRCARAFASSRRRVCFFDYGGTLFEREGDESWWWCCCWGVLCLCLLIVLVPCRVIVVINQAPVGRTRTASWAWARPWMPTAWLS